MRDNIVIIRKLFVILLFVILKLTLSAEPYKPYPVIFAHGVGVSSAT